MGGGIAGGENARLAEALGDDAAPEIEMFGGSWPGSDGRARERFGVDVSGKKAGRLEAPSPDTGAAVDAGSVLSSMGAGIGTDVSSSAALQRQSSASAEPRTIVQRRRAHGRRARGRPSAAPSA